MWQFGVLFLCVAGANAAYSSSGAGAYSGTGTGTGLYSSNYASNDIYGSQFPYVGGYVGGYAGNGYFPQAVPPFVYGPGYGFPIDLQNFIHSQYHHLQKQFNQIQSLYADQFAQQAAFFNNLQQSTGVVAGPGETVIYTNYPKDKTKVVYTDTNSYAPSYSGAAASGAVGPGGVYQSVSTYPGGTVSNRFGGGPTYTTYSSGGGPGFSGISTSAFSDSTGNRQATTSVNNNGKVTTYHTRAK
jgi:hypothetical protein